MLVISVGMDQKDSCALVVVTAVVCAWLVCLVYSPFTVFLSFVDRPRMRSVWDKRNSNAVLKTV